MNEQRQQAYLQLIKELLSCPNGEEPGILQAHQDLLDADFLQTLEAVAEYFAQQGNENNAGWLRKLATQLRGGLNLDTTAPDLEAYGQFLQEVLQTTAESNGNPQVVYPLLAANTDKLNDTFAELLRLGATNTLAEAEPDAAEYIAGVIGNFSNLINQFPLGNKASNMEIAITLYEIALTIFTRTDFPQDWATTQNNLGAAYRDRIRGDQAENLEMAIAAYTDALQIRTRADFPQDWATTQNNLGAAYRDRIRGDQAENLEMAIAAYTDALQIYTRPDFPQNWATTRNNLGTAYSDRIRGDQAENLEMAIAAYTDALQIRTRTDFPQDWASTQNNLGNVYRDRIRGDQAENLEMAIAAYTDALQIRTRTDFPQDWASTQNNLGNVYRDRIRGDQAENLEMAIVAYTAALQIRTRTDFPQNWATTQNNLGNAYSNRIRGDQAENLEMAIAAYTAALQVYTRTDFPQNWAMTQNNLGTAYKNRIRGDQAENLEMAIAAYTAALQVRTRTDFPQNWATTQNNLGNAYSNRIRGDQAENLEMAIAAYTDALQIYTRADFPQNWATTQNNLGNAYSNRIRGDQAENLEMAIAAYTAALQIYTRADFPQDHAKTLVNLGRLYQNSNQFSLAESTFASAIETVENLRDYIVSGEESKRKQAEEWNKLYRRMVEVCLALGKKTEAIEYVERSKTRNLVELILNRDLKTTFPPDVVTQLEQLRGEIASGQYQIQNGKAENPTALAQHLQKLRQLRNELQNQYLPVGYSFKLDRFQSSLDANTVIIEWYITFEKIIAFVINTQGQKITVWQSQLEDREYFFDWINEYLSDYYEQKYQWQNQLEERLKKLAETLHIEEILTHIPKHCDRLILIPHRFLHLLPLHTLPVKNSYLLDLFPKGVGYSPSCQLLQQIQLRQRPDFESLFAIQNPTDDLIYADLEVESIQHYFPADKTTVLRQKDATRNSLDINLANLANINYLHFSCHGSFNLNTPEDSCLYLNGSILNKQVDLNQCLTLGDLFNKDFNLNQCRLVVLSACETGLIDFNNTSDEYIGLPSGFLYAGSSSVVSSLWTVDQVSTAFLFIQFYENLQKYPELKQGDIAVALNQALIWLRELTSEQGEQFLQQIQPYIDSMFQGQDDILKELFVDGAKTIVKSHPKPFANPFYWSAFTAIGY